MFGSIGVLSWGFKFMFECMFSSWWMFFVLFGYVFFVFSEDLGRVEFYMVRWFGGFLWIGYCCYNELVCLLKIFLILIMEIFLYGLWFVGWEICLYWNILMILMWLNDFFFFFFINCWDYFLIFGMFEWVFFVIGFGLSVWWL